MLTIMIITRVIYFVSCGVVCIVVDVSVNCWLAKVVGIRVIATMIILLMNVVATEGVFECIRCLCM